MNNIITNNFKNYKIRTILINNEAWFVAKDIAVALDYPKSSIKSLTNLIKHIPKEWRGLNPVHTLGGNQNMQTLSEQGLYFFVIRSDKPQAIPLQKWISKDVLPSIRKTGSYSIQPTQKSQTQLSEFQETLDFIDIFEKFSEKTKGKSNLELLKLDSFLKKSDKKSVLDILNLDLKNSYFSVSELGELFGKKGSEINQALVKVGFQSSENGVWKVLESGKDFCFETQNSFSQLKWKFSVLEKI